MTALLNERYIVIFLHNRPFFGAHLVHVPFLVMLRKKYPGAKLVGVTKNSGASFLVDSGFLDSLEIIDKRDKFSLLKKYNFDIGFNLRPSSIGVALQMLLLKIPHRVGFKKTGAFYTHALPLDVSIYRADLFLKLMNETCASSVPHLKSIINHDERFLDAVLLVPGAGKEEKKWPIEKYMQLADQFVEDGEKDVFFITGPQEAEEETVLKGKGYTVFNQPSVDLLFSMIEGCKILISNDCGPSHIAHILGVRQVVLFKESLPEWFLTRDNSRSIFCSPGVPAIKVDDVMQLARELLEKNA